MKQNRRLHVIRLWFDDRPTVDVRATSTADAVVRTLAGARDPHLPYQAMDLTLLDARYGRRGSGIR